MLAALIVASSVQAGGAPCSETKLLPSDGATGDFFGAAVALDGGIAVIGANFADESGGGSGSAYVFTRGGDGVWVQSTELIPSDGSSGQVFGRSVGLSGDTAVIGSNGAAYVFKRDADDPDAGNQMRKLTVPDGPADFFGPGVAIRADVVIVGANGDDDNGADAGAAYIFRRDAGGPDLWGQVAKLTASDGDSLDRFGIAVSVGGDLAVVGARFDEEAGIDAGSAYVFRDTGTEWVQEQKLLALDGSDLDSFGSSVSIDGNAVVVGAQFGNSAYVFRSDGGVWAQEQRLQASDGRSGDEYGISVSVDGDLVVVGAKLHDHDDTDMGAAYVYAWNGATWAEEHELLASDGQVSDELGIAVSLSDGVVLAGAQGDADNGFNAGSAYVFELECGPDCPADVSGDGSVGVIDLTFVILAWGQTGGAADINQDGIVDVLDLVQVIVNWGPCS
jgi:hypothetical protein